MSGAWEGAVDTLLHVTAMGPGRTRLHIQKARWASKFHGQTFNLAWDANDSYIVQDKPERSDDDLAELVLAYIAENPGTGWGHVEEGTPGIRATKRREVRDRLLTAGRLVNIGKVDGSEVWLTECPERKPARLFLPNDPTIRHLRPNPDAAGTQSASGWGESSKFPASCVRPLRDAGSRDAENSPPDQPRTTSIPRPRSTSSTSNLTPPKSPPTTTGRTWTDDRQSRDPRRRRTGMGPAHDRGHPMSNRRRLARPKPSAAVRAYAAAYRCGDCDSDRARPRHDRQHPGLWHTEIRHDPTCPALLGQVSTRNAGLTAATAAANLTGARIAYLNPNLRTT